MGTTVDETLSASFDIVYDINVEYLQNCQVYASQTNYIELDNCDSTSIDAIQQSGSVTVNMNCLQLPDASGAADLLSDNATAAAVDMADEVYAGLGGADMSCPSGADCSYETILNMSIALTSAMTETMIGSCFPSVLSTNAFACNDTTSGATIGTVSQSTMAEQSRACVMSANAVTAPYEDLRRHLQGLQPRDESGDAAIIAVVVTFVVLIVAAGALQQYLAILLYAPALALSIVFLIGYFEQWPPYTSAAEVGAVQDNQELFVIMLLVIAILLLPSLVLTFAAAHTMTLDALHGPAVKVVEGSRSFAVSAGLAAGRTFLRDADLDSSKAD